MSVGLATADILDPNFAGTLSPAVLPLFYAMMYGATLGGNGTLVGASSNIVAAGIAEAATASAFLFTPFCHYGLPVTIVQLTIVSLYIAVRFFQAINYKLVPFRQPRLYIADFP